MMLKADAAVAFAFYDGPAANRTLLDLKECCAFQAILQFTVG